MTSTTLRPGKRDVKKDGELTYMQILRGKPNFLRSIIELGWDDEHVQMWHDFYAFLDSHAHHQLDGGELGMVLYHEQVRERYFRDLAARRRDRDLRPVQDQSASPGSHRVWTYTRPGQSRTSPCWSPFCAC